MSSGEDSSEDIARLADEWIAAHQAEHDAWREAARAAASLPRSTGGRPRLKHVPP